MVLFFHNKILRIKCCELQNMEAQTLFVDICDIDRFGKLSSATECKFDPKLSHGSMFQ